MNEIYLELEQVGSTTRAGECLYVCPKCQRPKMYWNCYSHLGGCWGCLPPARYNLRSVKRVCKVRTYSGEVPNVTSPIGSPVVLEFTHHLPPEAVAFLSGDKGIWKEYHHYFLWDIANQRLAVELRNVYDAGQPKKMFRELGGGWKAETGMTKSDYLFLLAPVVEASWLPSCIIVVEGVFDALSVFQVAKLEFAGRLRVLVIALCGSEPYTPQVRFIGNIARSSIGLGDELACRVYSWLDPDKAGISGAIKLQHRLSMGYGVEVADIKSRVEPNDLSPFEIAGILNREIAI